MGYQENCLPPQQQNLGHEVVMVTSTEIPEHRSVERTRFPPGEYEYNGVRTVRLEPLVQLELTNDVVLRRLHRTLRDIDPDVIHAHGTLAPSTLQAIVYGIVSSTPVLIDEHLDEDNFSLSSPKRRLLFKLFTSVIAPIIRRSAEGFLPINQYSKRFLIEQLGVPEEDIEVLPNGIDTEQFHPDEEVRTRVRQRLGFADDDFVCVTAGHLEPEKDIETIIKAFDRTLDSFPDAHLLIIGPGPDSYMNDLEEQVDQRGIGDHVRFLGFVDRETLSELFNAADVGIWPGVGITQNEAIGTGLPAMIAERSSISHLVESGNGMMFERGNSSDLAECIKKYGANPALVETHSERAVEYAETTLSWHAIAKQSIESYEEAQVIS